MGWYLNTNCKNNHTGYNQQTKHSVVLLSLLCLKMANTEKNILREGDDVIVNTEDICNVFNDYFINAANDMCETDNKNIDGPLEE